MKRMWWAAAAAMLWTSSALAADQAYQAQATLVPFGNPLNYQTYGYMEVWGVGSYTRYANPATDTGDTYHGLIAGSEAASAAALSGYTGITARFGYDPTASPYFVSATGNSARYAIGSTGVDLTGAGVTPFGLTASDNALFVSRNATGTRQVLNFGRTTATVEGPIPGSTFSYGGAPANFQVDLVGLLGPGAYFVSGFDLSAFTTLPVRLTAPTEFRPVAFNVQLQRFVPGAGFGIAPPETLALGDWNTLASVVVAYDGVYGIAVDRADYASNDAFLAASTWVADNVRQINFEQIVTYDITSLAPVPELPTAWLLLMGGVPALLLSRRRRR